MIEGTHIHLTLDKSAVGYRDRDALAHPERKTVSIRTTAHQENSSTMDSLESSELYNILADSVGLGSTDELEQILGQHAAPSCPPILTTDQSQSETDAKVIHSLYLSFTLTTLSSLSFAASASNAEAEGTTCAASVRCQRRATFVRTNRNMSGEKRIKVNTVYWCRSFLKAAV